MTILTAIAGAAIVAAAPVQTADLGGVWEGRIAIGGQSIRVVFRVDAAGNAVMDSPDQGALNIAVDRPTIEGGVVRFVVPSVRGRFEGTRSDDGRTLTGALHQGAASLPLVLTRTAATAVIAARPQTPVPPFPYRSEEVTIDNPAAPGVRLSATLTLPEGPGPFPAAILITGSGPQDRDESILGHRPFLVWADALTRRGIAVLRYDDRGVARSTGDFAAATSADFATDARAVFDWLAARPDIDRARIGMVGHSEGGLIAPLAAQNGAAPAWIVMLAGPAISGGEILSEQQKLLATAAGAPPEAVAAGNVVQRALMEIVVRNAADGEVARREVEAYLTAAGSPPEQAAASARQITSDWYRWFIAHDPAPALGAFHGPLLALYGGKDLQVPAGPNAEVLARVAPRAEIVVMPGLNHLLQTAATGQPAEYATIEQTLDPEALKTVVDWIAARSER